MIIITSMNHGLSKHWCINNNNNRMYFTKENGIRIDKYRELY